jgi:hypothetical protein
VGRVFNQQRIRITHENLFKGYDRRKKNKKREIRAKAIYKSGQQSVGLLPLHVQQMDNTNH